MFKITPAYNDLAADAEFLARLEPLLRASLPPQVAAQRDVGRMAQHCLETARAEGLTTERAIAAFALHMVTVHPRFFSQPRIRAILADRTLLDRVRMSRLVVDVTESDWEEARAAPGADAYWEQFRLVQGQSATS
jgi:hypothetical protein